MQNNGVQKICKHYKDILGDHYELLNSTQSFEQGNILGFKVEDVRKFEQERERRITALKQKEAKSFTLRSAVCQELGLTEFTLNNLSTKISEGSLKELSEVMAESKHVIEEIQEIDTRLNETLSMEMEATKLELHRFQNARRLQHAYQNENEREARFIDKTK
jgi:hypothetical protein